MNMQKMFDAITAHNRKESLDNSDQLLLGELILKLEAIEDKNQPIYIDDLEHKPSGLCSWRGSYRELAVTYNGEAAVCYDQLKEGCQRDEWGDHHYQCPCGVSNSHTTLLVEPRTKEFLEVLKLAQGRFFEGWKGGDFTMTKNTPLWIANEGDCSGFKKDEYFNYQAIVDVTEDDGKVFIHTVLQGC